MIIRDFETSAIESLSNFSFRLSVVVLPCPQIAAAQAGATTANPG